ncbi:NAD/NADP octopine/nopaline dehydrogenase family protein [Chloroflexota bacterium]
MNNDSTVAILGAGNGGLCAAADLTLRGFQVHLSELPEFVENITPVEEAGGISLRGVAGEGFAKLALVTNNIEKAIQGAGIILVIVHSKSHKSIARTCAPYLDDGQLVLLVPGNCGGVLEFRNELLKQGGLSQVLLAETTSLMYAVKKTNGNSIWARGVKKYLPLAAFPGTRTEAALERLRPLYKQFSPVKNVLETSFNNLNNVVHPVGIIMNLGFVESERSGDWFFYNDGYTQGVGEISEQLDKERLSLVREYGLPEISVVEALLRFYGHQGMNGRNLHELFRDSPIHHPAPGPKTTDNRMITEDVPYGLVPLTCFASLAGVPTPTMDAVITMASVVNKTDYRKTGRTLESLGLKGKTIDAIQHYVDTGSF